MGEYKIGEFIREIRKRHGYTQEELCFGICTPGNLSKIENGLRIPEWRTFEALLERLGLEAQLFTALLSEEGMQWHYMKQAVCRGLMTERLENQEEIWNDMLRDRYGNQPIRIQVMDAGAALRKLLLGEEREKVQERYWKALHRTAPHFDGLELIQNRLYTDFELTLILCLSHNGCRLGRIRQGIRILYWLKKYLEDGRIQSEQKARLYTMVLARLSEWLLQKRRFQDSAGISDTGIEFCKKFGCLHALPALLTNRGHSLTELGRIEEAREVFMRARVLHEIIGCRETAKTLACDIEKLNRITV